MSKFHLTEEHCPITFSEGLSGKKTAGVSHIDCYREPWIRIPLSPPGLLRNPSKSITYFVFNELPLSALPTNLCKLCIF
jgi:hypothetical protein